MPTIFSKCEECLYHNYLPMEHTHNKSYKRDYDKMELLKEYGLSTEIAIKIIEMTYSYHNCDYCTNSLCTKHKERGIWHGGSWPYIKCEQCCLNEIT
jgi:hypothetical protein